jgi:hypothetical protein
MTSPLGQWRNREGADRSGRRPRLPSGIWPGCHAVQDVTELPTKDYEARYPQG